MDRQLRLLKRHALRTNTPESWKAYANALERAKFVDNRRPVPTWTFEEILILNEEEDLYFLVVDPNPNPSHVVVFVPSGWVEHYGPDMQFPEDGPSVFGYGQLGPDATDINTGWFIIDSLGSLITEAETAIIHPELIDYLERLNQGEI